MQLLWLQTFMAVYHTGSFTKAARQLGITQPTVTQQVRGLELEFGLPLFERTPRGVVPTPSATVLAKDVQDSLKNLSIAIGRHFGDGEENRPLRIGATPELAAARLMPALSRLAAGGMDIKTSVGVSYELLDRLSEGFLDLVVSTIRPRRRGLEATPLADEELILTASPAMAQEMFPHGVTEDDVDLVSKAPLIAYAETLPLIRQYWKDVFDTTPTTAPSVVVPDLRAVMSAVISAAGISVLPRCLCSAALASGALVTLLEPELPPINTLYLVVQSGTLADYRLSQVHSQLLRSAQMWT
ncbi:LysR family transcriptional regulator [Streptomyces sp. NPDC087917]|uniref:LysR family transcriptional regulator n=1 Tax=Streptomyces sp. NPDC087917 TaxID=3155060 RepID=UPI0034180C0D